MKRFLSTILTIVFVVCLFTGCDSDLEDVGNDPLESSGFDVTIEIECVENWIFSKYDVDVYVGDSLEGTIAHGDTKIFNLHLDKGTHALRFISAENDNLTGGATLHIHKDESLKYKISCSSSGIDVDTIVGTTPPNDDTNGGTETGYTLDYADAASFEAALNNDEKVNGKVVQFVVNSYKPDSALGINCWAGEHLNFISENELNVVAGDVIIGCVTAEPSKVFGSWKIPYIVLVINDIKTDATIPTIPEETTPSAQTITVTMSEDDFKGMNYKEAEKIFREMGFTSFEYRTVNTEIESAADTISYIEITEWLIGNSDFVKGDKFNADSTVTFFSYKYEAPVAPSPVFYSTNDYETAQKGNTGVFSYKNKTGSYDVYWIIDFDEGYVYFFTEGNGENYCDKVKLTSGTLNDRVTITWNLDGEKTNWYLHFKYVNSPVTLIVNDHLGLTTEFTTTDLDDALALRDTKKIQNS